MNPLPDYRILRPARLIAKPLIAVYTALWGPREKLHPFSAGLFQALLSLKVLALAAMTVTFGYVAAVYPFMDPKPEVGLELLLLVATVSSAYLTAGHAFVLGHFYSNT